MNTRTFWTVNSLLVVALLLWLGGLHLWAQDQPLHDKYRDDPAAFCRKGPNDPADPSAHSCHCELMCSDGSNGVAPEQMENAACEMWCTKSRCACWTDDPCRTPPVL